MDPYEDRKRKYLSPLDKKEAKPLTPVEAFVETPAETEQASVTDQPLFPMASLFEHITELRKQMIKGLVVFILFFYCCILYH